jgi:protein-S-isoprenylcysteine O-methyltransferase Ste14
MLTGIYQSIPLLVTLVAYYILDIWLMRSYHPDRTIIEKRDTLNTSVSFIAIILIVIQPVVLPGLGVHITTRWGLVVQMVGVACLVSGLILFVWVRMHLRNLFSEQVELQPGHYVVQTGPYAWVRHPMYSTFFLLIFGHLLIKPALIELFLLCFVIWHFSNLAQEEERLLSKELPGYQAYMAVTPRFVPAVWRNSR